MIFSDVVNQGLYFCTSLFCGIICGIYYDIFYAIRVLLKAGKILLLIFDLVFFILSIGTVFFFMYRTNGFDLKWYIILGIICGFLLERYSFKKPVAQIVAKVYNILKGIKRFLIRFKIFNKILN